MSTTEWGKKKKISFKYGKLDLVYIPLIELPNSNLKIETKGFETVWFICQSNLYQTNPPTENKYKTWIKHIKQVCGVRRDQLSQQNLKELIPERKGNVHVHWKFLDISLLFSPHTIF